MLAVGIGPVLFEELLGVFGQAARRRDRVPGEHAGAPEDGPQGGCLVAFDQDLVAQAVDPLDPEREIGGQVGLGPGEAGAGAR